jgi:ribosomal subunit interface protein
MKIDIKYTQFKPTEDIVEHVVKKIGSLERFLKSFEKDGEITVFVEIARSTKHHKKGDVFYAEATFETTPGGKTIRATDTQADIRISVDNVKEKLKKEIRRYKDKLIQTRRR